MINNDFVLIPGMPRAGSSWLYYNLKNHPDICAAKGYKETFFFGANYSKGFKWYYSLYKPNIKQICLDASPDYFLNDNFLKNLFYFKNNYKVILVLRNPSEWVISLYNQIKSFNPKVKNFDDYIKNCKIEIDGNSFEYSLKNIDIKKRIDQFLNVFKGKILLIDFNYMIKNQVQTLQLIENFLCINSFFKDENVYKEQVNVSIGKFSYIKYFATLKYSRFLAFKFLPKFILEFLRKKIYKIDKKKSLSIDSPNTKRISNMFPEIVSEYFKDKNIISH